MAPEQSGSPSLRPAVCAYAVSAAVFICLVYLLGKGLPERVATHFDFAGRANNWSSRTVFEISLGLTGLLVSGFVMAVCYATRFFPAKSLNVPHPEYWRDPAHRPAASAFIFRHSVWLGAVLNLWFGAFYFSIVRANASVPAHLSDAGWAVPTLIILGFLAVWSFALVRHFARIPER
jgi:serine/threonine-protein kinase